MLYHPKSYEKIVGLCKCFYSRTAQLAPEEQGRTQAEARPPAQS